MAPKRQDAAWNPSEDWDAEADTGVSNERMRLARLWLRVGDYYTDAELTLLIEALEAYRDCPPDVRAAAVAALLAGAQR